MVYGGPPPPPAPAYSVGGPPEAAAKPLRAKFFRRDFSNIEPLSAPAAWISHLPWAHFPARGGFPEGPALPKISRENFPMIVNPPSARCGDFARAPGASRRGAYLTLAGEHHEDQREQDSPDCP